MAFGTEEEVVKSPSLEGWVLGNLIEHPPCRILIVKRWRPGSWHFGAKDPGEMVSSVELGAKGSRGTRYEVETLRSDGHRLLRGFTTRNGQPLSRIDLEFFQLLQLIANRRGFLEFEVFGSGLHSLLEIFDALSQRPAIVLRDRGEAWMFR